MNVRVQDDYHRRIAINCLNYGGFCGDFRLYVGLLKKHEKPGTSRYRALNVGNFDLLLLFF